MFDINASQVSSSLERVKSFFLATREEDGEEYIDVRLQVFPSGSWTIHRGDSSYDQDHRGYWGAGSIGEDTDCADLARDLISEAEEDYYMSGDADDDEERIFDDCE